MPASQGAAEDDSAYHSRVKDAQIRSYFYGGPSFTQGVLSPFSIIVKFDDLRIVRVGEGAPSLLLTMLLARRVGALTSLSFVEQRPTPSRPTRPCPLVQAAPWATRISFPST